MSESIELQEFSDNNNALSENKEEGRQVNGDYGSHATEASRLLAESPAVEIVDGVAVRDAADVVILSEEHDSISETQRRTQQREGAVARVKRDLNEVVVWKLRLWMVIIIIVVILALVFGVSFCLLRVGHEDVDEMFNKDSFAVPRYFKGNFTVGTQNNTSHSLYQPSQSDALFYHLKEKLTDVYSSSPALGRYFVRANITTFRYRDNTAQFELKFTMPFEHDRLIHYTLSRDMVYSVFLQLLYDQDPEDGNPLYISPASLNMEVGRWGN